VHVICFRGQGILAPIKRVGLREIQEGKRRVKGQAAWAGEAVGAENSVDTQAAADGAGHEAPGNSVNLL
jgi:hypothetical protein